jgi:serine/threonine protein kinase
MIGRTVSHYRIISEIGKGGMGVVYVGEDIVLGRRVAIKTMTGLDDEQHYRMRFLREARSASALSHPHVAAVYDYGETPEGTPFIVMELAEGRTLDKMMEGGTLALAPAVEIAEKVAEALAAAHRLGIVHRDIKPSNVAVGANGEVKVLDFGMVFVFHITVVVCFWPEALGSENAVSKLIS